jgi:hypothetical protein
VVQTEVWISCVQMTVYSHSTEMLSLEEITHESLATYLVGWMLEAVLVILFSFEVFNLFFYRGLLVIVLHGHTRRSQTWITSLILI